MRYGVRRGPGGLWVVVAPSGQAAGLCVTQAGAVDAAHGLSAMVGRFVS